MKTSFTLLLVACLLSATLCTEANPFSLIKNVFKKKPDGAASTGSKVAKSAGGTAATTGAGIAIQCAKTGCNKEQCVQAGLVKPNPRGCKRTGAFDCYDKAVCAQNGSKCSFGSITDINNCLRSKKLPTI